MKKKLDKTLLVVSKELIEKERKLWSKVARKYKWYTEPFYVQVWINKDSSIYDSISFKGIEKDIFVSATTDKLINIIQDFKPLNIQQCKHS